MTITKKQKCKFSIVSCFIFITVKQINYLAIKASRILASLPSQHECTCSLPYDKAIEISWNCFLSMIKKLKGKCL